MKIRLFLEFWTGHTGIRSNIFKDYIHEVVKEDLNELWFQTIDVRVCKYHYPPS